MSGSESTGKIPVLPLRGKAPPASPETRTIAPASNEALPPESPAPEEKTGFDPSSSFFPPQLPGVDVDGKRKRRSFAWVAVAALVLAVALGYGYFVMQERIGTPKTGSAKEESPTRIAPKGAAASGPVLKTGTIRAASPQPRAGDAAVPPQETAAARPAPSPKAAAPGASRARPAPATPAVPLVTHTHPAAASGTPNAEEQLPQPAPHAQPGTRACSPEAEILGLCERPATDEPTARGK